MVVRPRLSLQVVPMAKWGSEERKRDFREVARGYTPDEAVEEAQRCLQCPRRPCVDGCPVGIAIPDFILALRQGYMPQAVRVLKESNNLPAVCGRVCPQENQCQSRCVVGKRGDSVSIGALERFVADWELAHGREPASIAPATGREVAVIGSGPAGLTCAADLARMGHKVVIYEALHTAGGVLTYGIPDFRLPAAVVQAEVDYVQSLGVDIKLDMVVGQTITVDEVLADGAQAVFIGTGAGLPLFLHLPGEDLTGIYSANEFLTRTNLMKAYLYPTYDTSIRAGRRVAIIGGGNVAMDSARCAMRLGAREVSVVYRRTEEELPARREEVENAKEEGVIFRTLTAPLRFLGDGRGQVVAMECQGMKLGPPDATGRPRPIPQADNLFSMAVDTVVLALGTTPHPLLLSATPGLEASAEGTVIADEHGRTSRARLWGGGDIVSGAATVVSAIGAAKKAALDIDRFLRD